MYQRQNKARKLLSRARWLAIPFLAFMSMLLSSCAVVLAEMPTLMPTVIGADSSEDPSAVPPTWTAMPTETSSPTWTPLPFVQATPRLPRQPTRTPLPIPTNTPVTPSPTPSNTPTPSPTPTGGVLAADIRPLNEYDENEVIPIEAFPRPPNDNGWGIHWIPTYQQDPAVVDRFVDQAVRMHIKWVVFLNNNSNIGDNVRLTDQNAAVTA